MTKFEKLSQVFFLFFFNSTSLTYEIPHFIAFCFSKLHQNLLSNVGPRKQIHTERKKFDRQADKHSLQCTKIFKTDTCTNSEIS